MTSARYQAKPSEEIRTVHPVRRVRRSHASLLLPALKTPLFAKITHLATSALRRNQTSTPSPDSDWTSLFRYDSHRMTTATEKRYERIYATIRDIPQGCVASYGQIAEIAGVPRGARQVGYALRHLPNGHDVPWYRVIRSSGRIAFEKGSDAFNEQSKRLMMEDVAILEGRIDMQKYRWQPDLDELLWKPSSAWDDE